MKIYKIASILYTGYDYKIEDYTEKETVNHIFIEDNSEIPSLYTVNKIAVSLCHKFQNGINILIEESQEKDIIKFNSLEKYFNYSKHQKICKICLKKAKILKINLNLKQIGK
jgi:hypothetical protein